MNKFPPKLKIPGTPISSQNLIFSGSVVVVESGIGSACAVEKAGFGALGAWRRFWGVWVLLYSERMTSDAGCNVGVSNFFLLRSICLFKQQIIIKRIDCLVTSYRGSKLRKLSSSSSSLSSFILPCFCSNKSAAQCCSDTAAFCRLIAGGCGLLHRKKMLADHWRHCLKHGRCH